MSKFSIPGRLNVAIALFQIALMLLIFYVAGISSSIAIIILLAVLYGLVMNSGYALLHEAEHNLFHKNKRINDFMGIIIGLFFPAPFHLLRQGHLGHHIRNRSDDEAFDFYFDEEFVILKYLRLYGILTGMFWVIIVVATIFSAIVPGFLLNKIRFKDRPTEAVIESLNSKYFIWVQLESICVLSFQVFINYIFGIPIWAHLLILYGFGFMWSTIQYVHHFGTERDVLNGAKNLKTFHVLDLILLNHNWHLNHHQNPTISWLHLPKITKAKKEKRESFMKSYYRQWLGPTKANIRVKNKYEGKVIR